MSKPQTERHPGALKGKIRVADHFVEMTAEEQPVAVRDDSCACSSPVILD